MGSTLPRCRQAATGYVRGGCGTGNMTRVSKASPRRRGIRVLCLSIVLVVVGLLAGGCVRVHAAIAVSTDDRVSGDVVIASLPSAQNSQGPQLTIPTTLAGQV